MWDKLLELLETAGWLWLLFLMGFAVVAPLYMAWEVFFR